MSNTKVDLAKVTQMLDTGWTVKVYRNEMGSYTAEANHTNAAHKRRTRDLVSAGVDPGLAELARATALETDDFTPEQALTRMAYKVFGEII